MYGLKIEKIYHDKDYQRGLQWSDAQQATEGKTTTAGALRSSSVLKGINIIRT